MCSVAAAARLRVAGLQPTRVWRGQRLVVAQLVGAPMGCFQPRRGPAQAPSAQIWPRRLRQREAGALPLLHVAVGDRVQRLAPEPRGVGAVVVERRYGAEPRLQIESIVIDAPAQLAVQLAALVARELVDALEQL